MQRHHVRVGDPVGRGNDHFVALVQRGGKGVVDDVLGAVAHGDVLGLVRQRVLAQQLVGDGLAQGRRAVGGRVARLSRQQGRHPAFDDVGRRREVGLADGEVDDAAAGRAHGIHARLRRHAGRRFDAAKAMGQQGVHGALRKK
jgi:hypothetical protein